MKIYRDIGSLKVVLKEDAEGFMMPVYEIDVGEAEPIRRGRWQVNEMFGHKDMTCLSCGWLFEYYNGLEEEWNYCPNCGAKMDEVAE